MKHVRIKKYTCLVYGEGRKDKKFLITLIDLKKFKYHTQKWHFNYDNASGGSPKSILEQCRKTVSNYNYDHIICFIDLDKLKTDFPTTWEKEKIKIEKTYFQHNINIIWQIDKLEDEFKKVLGNMSAGKKEINKLAQKKINKFINSNLWKQILDSIKTKEAKIFSEQIENKPKDLSENYKKYLYQK